jgi:MFS family permease
VWTTNLVAFLFGAGLYSAFGFLPEFVQTPSRAGYGFGSDTTAAGLFLLPLTVSMFVFGMLSSHAAARIGSKRVLLIGSLSTVPPFALFAFAHHDKWEIYLASALLGIGLGLAFSAMSNRIVEAVPADQVGVASGMNANIRTIGGAIGASIMASIVTANLLGSGFPADSGYTRGFAFLAAVMVVAGAAALLIPKSGIADVPPHDAHLDHAELAIVAGGTITDA